MRCEVVSIKQFDQSGTSYEKECAESNFPAGGGSTYG